MQLDLPLTMQAWRRDLNGVLVLTETLIPDPKDDEVLVRLSAVGINPVDYKASSAGIQISTGVDGAGKVAALGNGVKGLFSIGERVMFHASLLAMRSGRPETGSFAEFAVVPIQALVRIPDWIDDQTAATLPCPAGTAQQVVDGLRETIEKTQCKKPAIFVQGASGSVARFVVQLLAHDFPGLHIIGSSSVSSHNDLTRFGVTAVDYKDQNGSSGAEFELSQVIAAAEKRGSKLIAVVNFQGGVSADLHYSVLGRGDKLVCVLDGPRTKELARDDSPELGMIALGQAYDVEAAVVAPKDAVEAYQRLSAQSAVAAMADAYRRVAVRLSASGQGAIEPPRDIKTISFGEIAANLNTAGKTVALVRSDY